MAVEPLLLALGWLGAGLAALFAVALAARRGGGEGERWLAAGFAVAAAAAGLITASHSGARSSAVEAAEVVATLAAGPLAAAWIAHGVGWRLRRWWSGLALAPAAGWALLAAAGAPWSLDRRAIRWAVLFQIGWTIAAAALFISRRAALGASGRRLLAVGLAALVALHAAQLARLLAVASVPRNLVPATLGGLLAALALAALRQTRLSFAIGGGGSAEEAEARALVAALDRWLIDERAFLERGLTVGAAARRLGVPAARLSRALNRSAGRSFPEHLAFLRVAEAERLLGDASLAHLSVEAIGTRAGFGSRSVFYEEFRRRTGRTPAEVRLRGGEGSG